MGTLYVVATPIGNLEDVTLRALRILAEVDQVLAEDTRRTRVLLDRHGIRATLRSLHAHNEVARSEEVLESLEAGRDIALVSDAGTPLISDPGERLVARLAEAGHAVVSIPGPSAPLAALVASGLSSAAFTFEGFLPRKQGERLARLAELSGREETLIFFEAPGRLARTLSEMAEVFGERTACVARELTKLHEEIARGTLAELADRFGGEVKGEVTLVVAGQVTASADPDGLRPRVREELAAGRSARDIAADLHAETGVPRKALYAIVLEERGEG
jgi:16S rRNA (cytidine1402-2'-O)-methyltransferase